jgi:uncharacterized membrane protein YecN with MAPEG domain
MASGLYNTGTSSSSSLNTIQNTLNNTGINLSGFNLDAVVVGINYFVLALCIFNTALLGFDFVIRYFKMTPQDEFLKYHLEAKKSFFRSWNTWTTYLPLAILLGIYAAVSTTNPWNWIVGILFVVASLIKIFWEYSKTPVARVLSGEDSSIIGRFFKSANDLGKGVGGGDKKGSKGGDSVVSVSGGILGEFVNQVGGLGGEALRQTTGVSVTSAPPADKKK